MNLTGFEDRLELLGLLAGVFLVIAGLGMLANQPWSTTTNTTAALVQVVGIVAMVAVGAVTVLVTQSEEVGDVLPTS